MNFPEGYTAPRQAASWEEARYFGNGTQRGATLSYRRDLKNTKESTEETSEDLLKSTLLE